MPAPHKVVSCVPVGVNIVGPRYKIAIKTCELIFASQPTTTTISTSVGQIHLDTREDSQRLLNYAFENVLRYYANSPLGRYIARNRGGTFVDIGANLGMYSLLARRAGMGTHLIEPDPAHVSYLTRNAHVLGQVHSIALSNARSELPLYYEPGNPGATSLFPAEGYRKGQTNVYVSTFSELIEQGQFNDPAEISLIKVDVEGFENEVIEGMTSFLCSGYRPAVWCEVRGDRSTRNGGSFRRVRDQLSSFGYTHFMPSRTGFLRLASDDNMRDRRVFDLLFVSET